jgi:hypothetical protein
MDDEIQEKLGQRRGEPLATKSPLESVGEENPFQLPATEMGPVRNGVLVVFVVGCVVAVAFLLSFIAYFGWLMWLIR